MGLHLERIGDVALVVPKGMMKGGKETDEVENDLRKLMHDDQQKILLDLCDTTHLSSMAIGVVVGAHKTAVERELYFCVCNVDKKIENVLTVLKLTRVLNVHTTREDALNAMKEL